MDVLLLVFNCNPTETIFSWWFRAGQDMAQAAHCMDEVIVALVARDAVHEERS